MQHQNIVFHSVLKQVPWHRFDRLVDEYGSDKHVRTLATKSQLIALTYAQLSGAQSLREIEEALESHAGKLYHLGGARVSRSTLSDANAQRPWQVFSGLFAHLTGQAVRGLRRKTSEAVHLIDATGLRLSALSKDWAQFSTGICGAKLHVVYDPDADCPIYAAVTPANVNDITAAKAMPIKSGATYVFDLGYYDYSWWAKLDEAGCRIVTRFKSNTPLCNAKEMPIEPASGILSDRIGFLPARQANSRKNPMQVAVREVVVMTETGVMLRILSNDLDAPAREIADLYKLRWQIELFFRLMKQTLKITHFIGRSENAVRIQIAVALIAFVLLHILQKITKVKHGFLELVRLVRANLMHRKDLTRLRECQSAPPIDSHQLVLDWSYT
jgi:IS4 transposase